MTKISKRQANKSYEIYLSLYQAVSGTEEDQNIYKQFSPDFFDLIVICFSITSAPAPIAETEHTIEESKLIEWSANPNFIFLFLNLLLNKNFK